MALAIDSIIYPVTDLAQAKAQFSTLFEKVPDQDTPYYVGFTVGSLQVGLDPNGHRKGIPGPVAYTVVDDIRKTLDELFAVGAEAVQEVTDVGGGKLIATVKDGDGNVFGVTQLP